MKSFKAITAAAVAFSLALPAFANLSVGDDVGTFMLESRPRDLGSRMNPRPMTGLRDFGDKEIAITVDDGPKPNTTPLLLKVFADHGVRATFFLVGNNVRKYPHLVRQIIEAGHDVGIHTMSHPDMKLLYAKNPKAAAAEIDDTKAALQAALQGTGLEIKPYFRFPFGAGASEPGLQALLANRNLGNFYWSMSAHDSRTQDPTEALKTSVDMLKKYKKGIFLFHETHPAGLNMIPHFLKELHKQNYTTIYFTAE